MRSLWIGRVGLETAPALLNDDCSVEELVDSVFSHLTVAAYAEPRQPHDQRAWA